MSESTVNYSPSEVSFASSSPYRSRRFDRQTRREAWEQLLKKTPRVKSGSSRGRSQDDSSEVSVQQSVLEKASTDDENDIVPKVMRLAIQQRDKKWGGSATTITTNTVPDAALSETTIGDSDGAYLTETGRLPQHLLESKDARYYKVVYRGVVALVSDIQSRSPKTGTYLSYGEIFSSSSEVEVEELETIASAEHSKQFAEEPTFPDSPPQSVVHSHTAGSVSSLETTPTASSFGLAHSKFIFSRRRVSKTAIRVDTVLTGGYAVDASDVSVPDATKTPKRSNSHYLVDPSPIPLRNCNDSHQDHEPETGTLGFIFSRSSRATIVEQISSPPLCEDGRFLYQIVSSTPIPILTGPSIDAPKTKAMLLPGTFHEVCLRLYADGEAVGFLRLSHRRGWITNRRISVSGNGVKVAGTPSVKEITQISSLNDDSSGSAFSIASSSTPNSVARRKHRPPRKKRENQNASLDQSVLSHQLHTASGKKGMSSSVRSISPLHLQPTDKNTTPASNISVLSDELNESTVSHPYGAPSSTPDRSLARSHIQYRYEKSPSFFLMRVNAPRGLRILDAPHFQVSSLIRGKSSTISERPLPPSRSHDTGFGATLPKGHTIFHTMGGPQKRHNSGNPAVFDSVTKTRILPRGVMFETSKRMESSTSFHQGAGLIKLSDNSGWAIVPRQDELDGQYRDFHGGVASVREGEATRAYEEVGNAIVNEEDPQDMSSFIWIRVVSRNGLTVECPPPVAPTANDDDTTSPTSSAGGSSTSGMGSHQGAFPSHESDVTSSVGSSFLDAMFRTPARRRVETDGKDGASSRRGLPSAANDPAGMTSNHLACGSYLQIDKWEEREAISKKHLVRPDYVRLRGGQGWLPRCSQGKPAVERISRPHIRLGSFWFRVLSQRGIKVRLGPSRRATSIKSEGDVYFRFECGEFLRASEVVTFFQDGSPFESFAKLYRNRHVRLNNNSPSEHRQLASLTTQAEWVQVKADDYTYLDECSSEPYIQRHRDGWRYNVVTESGISIRKGPSFSAEETTGKLLPGESVLVNERVVAPNEQVTWLRLKDGQGWTHDLGFDGETVMIAHSLRHRTKGTLLRKREATGDERNEQAYNAIIARLFHNDSTVDEQQERQGGEAET